MKKLLFVLLVVTLASFLLVGCLPGTTPAEGEGEGEGETPFLTIAVDDAVLIDGIKYVACGTHDITVTFAAPVAGWVDLFLYDCVGDYSKADKQPGQHYVLFPNDDRTVFTGSAYFGCCMEPYGVDLKADNPCDQYCTDCCATIIEVGVGECEECYYDDAVIVDCAPPELDLLLRFVDCGDPCDPCDETAGAYMEWTSLMEGVPCEDPEDCCGDDCSGIASWTLIVGDTLCGEPCDIISEESCPVEGVSDCCLYYATEDEGTVCYNITFTIADKVGNVYDNNSCEEGNQPFTTTVCLDTDEVISFNGDSVDWDADDLETDWMGVPITGFCLLFG